MRHRWRLLMSLLIPTLFYTISVLFNDAPMTSHTSSMTFRWKSRVWLHGHVSKKSLERKGQKEEEIAMLQEQLKLDAGMKGGTKLGRSLGSEGLLQIWRRNQLQVIEELQSLIKAEVKADGTPLISLIRRSLLAPSVGPLKTSHGVRMTSLADTVDRLLGPSTKGFFVEAGVYDAEASSHTLWLEKVRGWTGVLVEPDPAYFLQILGKNRRAWTLNAALSPSTSPALVAMEDSERQLGVVGGATSGGSKTLVPAYPIGSLLQALNQSHVDFLCLDVGGDEWTVLQTIPWEDVTVTVIAVKVDNSPVEVSQFVDLLTKRDYRCYRKAETQSGNFILCDLQDTDAFEYQEESLDTDEI